MGLPVKFIAVLGIGRKTAWSRLWPRQSRPANCGSAGQGDGLQPSASLRKLGRSLRGSTELHGSCAKRFEPGSASWPRRVEDRHSSGGDGFLGHLPSPASQECGSMGKRIWIPQRSVDRSAAGEDGFHRISFRGNGNHFYQPPLQD